MTKFSLRQNFFLHCHRRRSMVRLIPLLKRVFFCPKIQREALGRPSPAYPRRPALACRLFLARDRHHIRQIKRRKTVTPYKNKKFPLELSKIALFLRYIYRGKNHAPPHPMLHPVGATLAVAHSAAPHVTSRRGDPCGRPLCRTPCNPSVGAGFYPARSRFSAGADASARPPLFLILVNVF